MNRMMPVRATAPALPGAVALLVLLLSASACGTEAALPVRSHRRRAAPQLRMHSQPGGQTAPHLHRFGGNVAAGHDAPVAELTPLHDVAAARRAARRLAAADAAAWNLLLGELPSEQRRSLLNDVSIAEADGVTISSPLASINQQSTQFFKVDFGGPTAQKNPIDMFAINGTDT